MGLQCHMKGKKHYVFENCFCNAVGINNSDSGEFPGETSNRFLKSTQSG